MGRVSLVRHTGRMSASLSEALGLIGGLAHFVKAGDRVLLKPNLNGVEGCTNLALTESLVRMLLDLGAAPFIAESTFGDAKVTNLLFRKTGYSDLAARFGIGLFNLNESQPVDVQVHRPIATDRVRIAKEVFESDKIINLPNMKVHYATGITLSLKNLKGLLVGSEKRRFHEIGLDDAIVDLNNTIHPHLNIVDAITCMEGMGPRGGDTFNLNLILAGQNAAEVDYVGMSVMGYTLEEVGHLQRYLELNGIEPNRIEILGEKIHDVKRPFRKVNAGVIIPSEFIVHNHDACSSCMNAFLLSCSLLETRPNEQFAVHMGSHLPGANRTARTIAFGNCCTKEGRFDIVVKGCPPFPLALKEQIARVAEMSSAD